MRTGGQMMKRLQKTFQIYDPYFAVIKLRLNFSSDEKKRTMSEKDTVLLQYAALNIVKEMLDREWNHLSFYSPHQEISSIIQWDENQYGDSSVDKINQLEMIGRSLHFNIHKFLGFQCVVGISQILKGREFLQDLNEQVENLAAQSNQIVERANEYIHQNYMQKGITLNEVAQKNHVSPNYLSYLFKKNTGSNLWEYVIRLRMEESKRLIINTDLRRYEISERVGYESPEHFSKIFKKYFGISPSEMKKKDNEYQCNYTTMG
jgi:two-component system, response regulator YesN